MTVQGDAAVASELNWLIENLRWDIEDDLAGVVGPCPARQIVRFARSSLAIRWGAAKTVAASAGGLARRWRSAACVSSPRLLVIAWTIWRFGLDDLALSGLRASGASACCGA